MIWGKGPLDNSEAKDLLEALAPVLDCFDPFRDDDITVDADDVAYAELSATLLTALAHTGIDARPADSDVLVAEANLTETIHAALTADIALGRPAFARESAVERWLRDGGARYHVWMFAAPFVERAAAWAAADSAEVLCVMARLAGVPAVDLGRAFAATLVEIFGGDAEPLARLAADGAIKLDVPAWRSGGMHAAWSDFYRKHRAASDSLVLTPAQALDMAHRDFVERGTMKMPAYVHWLVDNVPALASKLRARLEPLVAGRL